MPESEETPAPHPHVDVEKVYGRASHEQPAAPEAKPVDKGGKFRKYFLYVLIGGVIVSALISIIAILIGEINDYIARALWTTLLMVVHAMIALAFISVSGNQRTRGQEIVVNTLFGLTIASFFTSTLGVWDVISGEVTGNLYQVYFNTLIAAFVVQALLSVKLIDKLTNRFMQAAIGLTVTMWAYLIPSAFDDSYPKVLPGVYYRGIAALGIALGTTIVLVVIFHKLHLAKHPELKAVAPATPKAGGMPIWLIVILCILGLPFAIGILSMLFGVLGFLFYR